MVIKSILAFMVFSLLFSHVRNAEAAPLEQYGVLPDREMDAMLLAINYFNDSHQKDLKTTSPEVVFFAQLLEQLDMNYPYFRYMGLSYPRENSSGVLIKDHDSLITTYFGAYRFTTIDSLTEELAIEEKIEKTIYPLLQNCPIKDNVTPAISAVKSDFNFIINEECLENNTTEGILFVESLIALGVESIEFYKTNEIVDVDNMSLSYSFIIKSKEQRDMNYVVVQLNKMTQFSFLVGTDTKWYTSDRLMGGAPASVSVAPVSSKDFSSPLELTFKRGWGDCMAGCIYKHSWKVLVTPQVDGPNFKFSFQLVSEDGDAYVESDVDNFGY